MSRQAAVDDANQYRESAERLAAFVSKRTDEYYAERDALAKERDEAHQILLASWYQFDDEGEFAWCAVCGETVDYEDNGHGGKRVPKIAHRPDCIITRLSSDKSTVDML